MLKKIKKSAQIENKIKEKYLYDTYEIEDLDEKEYVTTILHKTSGKNLFTFKFDITQDPYCCGLFSIGCFNMTNLSNIPKTEKVKLIRKTFEKLVKKVKDDKNKEYTLFFTLIDDFICNLIKEALKDEKLFTEVKVFTNINSGRKNSLYISN